MPSSTAALKALITRNPLIVSAKTTVADAIAQMHQAQPNPSAGSCGDSGLQDSYHQQVRSSCVLVVEHGKLIGLLSERDVVRLSAQQVQSAEVPLAQVMAQVSISLRESSLVDASSTIALIQQHGARHLPILDQQDYPTGLLTYESLQPLLLQEMRKQQQIEALLLESEQRYASLSAIAPVGIFCADASGRCTYVNDYYCQILQSTPDALLNQSWQENLHPEDRERVMAAWESCVRENRTFRTECRLCRSDGAVVWIHNQAMMERDASGQIIGYVGAITDISDRKRAETALRQSERTNSIIVDTIPDLLIQMQRSGRYSRIAGGSAVRVKLPASSKTAERDVHTVLPPELAQQRLHYANQAIDTGRLQIYEQVFDCGDGELRNEEVRVAPLDDAEVLIIIRDITDRKQAELQLQSLVEGTAATTGQDFFPPLVSHISQALNVSCAGVSEWVEGSLQTLALWGSGELRHNTCFDPKGLPCGRTMENGSYYFEGSISKDLLETLDISLDELRSYAGVALRGSSGESMGTLFVLNEQPIQNPQRAMQILQVFAARAAAELERQRATLLLERLNQQLETKVEQRTAALQEREQFLRTVLDTFPLSVFWKDRTSTYLGCNRNFLKDANVASVEDVIGKTDYDMPWAESEAGAYRADDAQVIQSNVAKLGIIETQITGDGRQIWLETNKLPLHNLQGDVIGVLGTYRDITGRRRADQALQESEQRFRNAIANAPFPIMIHAEDGEVLQISAAWTELSGYTHADIPTIEDWARLAYGDRAADLLRDVIRKKYALESRWDEGEFTIRVRDGSQRIWQFSSAPLGPLPDGRRVVTSMAADVTARRQAEIALRESEERYRSIYTQAAMGLANATLDGRLINVNPRFCEMVGYSYEELMSKTVEEITHPDDREKVRPEVERLFTGEKSYFFQEKRYIRRDGSCFWSATGVSVVCDAAGQPKHTLAVIRDISDRKQAEEHVHALLRRTQLLNRISSEIRDSLDLEIILQNLVNAVVAGVSVDACNFAWCLNDNPSDPSSSRLEIVKEKKTDGLKGCLGSYQYNDFPSLFDSILNNQLYRIDRLSEAPDEGLARNLECVGLLMFLCIPIHTSVGNIGSLQVGRSTDDQQWQDEEIELFQSIANQLAIAIYQAHLYQESQAKTTQLRQSYQELQDAQRHMVQAEKMSSLGQLVAGIAHEINNPVGFIYGNLSAASEYVSRLTTLIRQYQADYPAPSHELARTAKQLDIDYILKDFPKLLASMENGATRIQNIVKSLRTFSRLDQADHSAVAIHQHIENTLVILQNRLNGRAGNPEIHIIKQYGELPLVECYSSLMDQVFMNLLVNAVDAIEERQSSAAPAYSGCITITTSTAADDQVLISIRDNGIGMTSSTKAKIFNPFFTTKPIGIGTGMGLSISYQIVTGNHQGQLHCTSTPEEGTEFVIYLPLSLSQAPE